jgi:hypothetical protein
MIGLVNFLKAAGIEFDTDDLKIHLACWNGLQHPIDEYYAGNFEKWQAWQGRRNFKCAHIISLIDLGESNWLFAGVYRILGCGPHPKNREQFLYSTKLLPKQGDLIGRIIVHHKRTRQSYIWNKPKIALPITEIRPKKLTIEEFPGYNAVIVSHSSLKTITGQKIASWYGALANIKGIYLITDTTTGRHYVGKASGKSGIWQRWCGYAENGHGGNKELKNVLKKKGEQHMKHFQYSILEIADTHASDNDILARETYWMNALKSRKFGMN